MVSRPGPSPTSLHSPGAELVGVQWNSMFRVLTIQLKQASLLHLIWVAMSTLPERLIPLLSASMIQAPLGPTATPQQDLSASEAMLSLTEAIALARALQEHLDRLATVTP